LGEVTEGTCAVESNGESWCVSITNHLPPSVLNAGSSLQLTPEIMVFFIHCSTVQDIPPSLVHCGLLQPAQTHPFGRIGLLFERDGESLMSCDLTSRQILAELSLPGGCGFSRVLSHRSSNVRGLSFGYVPHIPSTANSHNLSYSSSNLPRMKQALQSSRPRRVLCRA
jgi:hypothetical protein